MYLNNFFHGCWRKNTCKLSHAQTRANTYPITLSLSKLKQNQTMVFIVVPNSTCTPPTAYNNRVQASREGDIHFDKNSGSWVAMQTVVRMASVKKVCTYRILRHQQCPLLALEPWSRGWQKWQNQQKNLSHCSCMIAAHKTWLKRKWVGFGEVILSPTPPIPWPSTWVTLLNPHCVNQSKS